MSKRKQSDGAPAAKKKAPGHWAMGLYASAEDPELLVESDERVIVIKDKYPKAKYHYLILPKEKLHNLKSLKKEHVPLLKHMQKKGEEIADKHRTEECENFRLGYHAVPSMGYLHLHAISQDFNSPCLKTKKHWNSFTTEYFFDSKDIIEMLEDKGEVQIDSSKFEALLKKPLQCHRCSMPRKTIPDLKKHILMHLPIDRDRLEDLEDD
ncbi:aprataxin-like [Lineus longissimus]|uniref:aprataxin-like n=1 Tax=Lineus longissimus TaxID=88925 RepID=UPI002B4EB9AB